MIDSGAQFSAIDTALASKLGLTRLLRREPLGGGPEAAAGGRFTLWPLAPEAAAAQRLLIRHKPERPALAIVSEPAGLEVGGIDPVEMADRMSGIEDQ